MDQFSAGVFADVNGEKKQVGWATAPTGGVRTVRLNEDYKNVEDLSELSFEDNFDLKAIEQVPRSELAVEEGNPKPKANKNSQAPKA